MFFIHFVMNCFIHFCTFSLFIFFNFYFFLPHLSVFLHYTCFLSTCPPVCRRNPLLDAVYLADTGRRTLFRRIFCTCGEYRMSRKSKHAAPFHLQMPDVLCGCSHAHGTVRPCLSFQNKACRSALGAGLCCRGHGAFRRP